MKLLTPHLRPLKPRQSSRLVTAGIAYVTAVCASIAAAVAVMTTGI